MYQYIILEEMAINDILNTYFLFLLFNFMPFK